MLELSVVLLEKDLPLKKMKKLCFHFYLIKFVVLFTKHMKLATFLKAREGSFPSNISLTSVAYKGTRDEEFWRYMERIITKKGLR